jgi:serine/threonine protein kinase
MCNPQGNVFMDGLGNPCLANFGLATVIKHPQLEELSPNSRWRAPEVVGVEDDPERPTFKSDIYSFGGVMFFVRFFVFLWLYPHLS